MPRFRISRSTVIITSQLLILLLLTVSLCVKSREAASQSALSPDQETAGDASGSGHANPDYIRWVDFTVPADVMQKAFRYDMDTCQAPVHLNWIELLAWLGAKYGGDFSLWREEDLDGLAKQLKAGESIETLTKDMKYYPYYYQAYSAVLGGMVGYFKQEIDASAMPEGSGMAAGDTEKSPGQSAGTPKGAENAPDGNASPKKTWVTKYGLMAYSPIAKNFPYTDYDDFGAARSYGYSRRHLGHDMVGQVGTPLIAVESGTVEALGWNEYGGWRIGIRSLDKKRYYYYAHLRQNYPYQSNLVVGASVTAGDVIGYLGRTGYSATENTNNLDTPHLHFGLQLIFDESQKEGENEIWIDCYELVKFLRSNQSEVMKVEGTKEWTRVYGQES